MSSLVRAVRFATPYVRDSEIGLESSRSGSRIDSRDGSADLGVFPLPFFAFSLKADHQRGSGDYSHDVSTTYARSTALLSVGHITMSLR